MRGVELFLLVGLAAAVYASVGHGGASAYLAILSLYGVAPAEMATSALVLNVLVAGVAALTYARAGHLSWHLVWPFVITSVPAAYLGGFLHVSPRAYALLLALALAFAAFRLWLAPAQARVPEGSATPGKLAPGQPRSSLVVASPLHPAAARPVRPDVALTAGAAIGVLSGIVGVGGGIFLSPLMILAGWAGAKETAAASAVFIVVNSAAGLAGRAARGALVLGDLAPLVAAAFVGGLAGAWIGARRLLPVHVRRVLAVTLLFVAGKSVWTGLVAR